MDFKCNNCKEEIDINEHELFELYDKDEGLHEIQCPHCGLDIFVQTVVTFDFEVCDEDGNELWDNE